MLKALNFENFDNSHKSFLWPEYFIDFLCERWFPFQASTSVLCLHYCPETVHCSTKDKRCVHFWNNFSCIITSLQSIFYCVQLLYMPISKHLYSGIFIRILWIRNTKSSKRDWIQKYFVICLKLQYFVVVKLNPWMGIRCNKWLWDGTLNVACRAGSTIGFILMP